MKMSLTCVTDISSESPSVSQNRTKTHLGGRTCLKIILQGNIVCGDKDVADTLQNADVELCTGEKKAL